MFPYAQQPDAVLLRLIAEQDDQALAALYDRHAPVIYNLIMRIVHEKVIADELLQETFWQVWLKAADYRSEGSVPAWLYRIARNKSLNQLRRQQARPRSHESGTEEAEQALWNTIEDADAQVDKIVQRRWEHEQLREALYDIPEEQRYCLELAYFDGMSQSQIAEHTRVPLGTIKTRIRMGLKKLRYILHTVGY